MIFFSFIDMVVVVVVGGGSFSEGASAQQIKSIRGTTWKEMGKDYWERGNKSVEEDDRKRNERRCQDFRKRRQSVKCRRPFFSFLFFSSSSSSNSSSSSREIYTYINGPSVCLYRIVLFFFLFCLRFSFGDDGESFRPGKNMCAALLAVFVYIYSLYIYIYIRTYV